MHKLFIPGETRFAEVNTEQFNGLKYATYILDFDWNYLFVNDYVSKNLGARGRDLVGKNMWSAFTELAKEPAFMRMKTDIEKGIPVNFNTNSPLTGQRLNIVGYPLKDCFFFYASQLPKKEDLMHELRMELEKEKAERTAAH